MTKRTVKAKTPAKTKAKAVAIDPFETVADEQPVSAAPKKRTAKAKVRSAVTAEASTRKRTAKTKVAEPARVDSEAADVPVGRKVPSVRTKNEKAKRPAKPAKKQTLDVTAELAAAEPEVQLSPVFKALAEPKLPELKRENRARLMMQSPTELYFYWSVKESPYQILKGVFGGDTGSYTLVVKLTELGSGTEEINRVESDGDWWFTVEPDGEYRAEIGFYAPNRPYFRILHSNTVATPRRAPSRHPAAEAEWRLPAQKFAQVLDVAGFSQDAFDVAIAGDDPATADETAHAAFRHFIDAPNVQLRSVAAEDIRYTIVALAAGLKLDDLRWRVSPTLFAFLQANADKLEAGKARAALSEHFDVDESEFVEESYGPAVHSGSLVNFPRTLKPRQLATPYRPLSSYNLG
jgi:hypothetical protein